MEEFLEEAFWRQFGPNRAKDRAILERMQDLPLADRVKSVKSGSEPGLGRVVKAAQAQKERFPVQKGDGAGPLTVAGAGESLIDRPSNADERLALGLRDQPRAGRAERCKRLRIKEFGCR